MIKTWNRKSQAGANVLGVVGVISMALTLGVSADTVISVNWSGDQRAVMAPTDVAGVVRAANWNTITNGAAASLTPIYADGTLATGVSITPSEITFANRGTISSSVSGDTKLFNGVEDISSTASNAFSISVTGLSFAEYDVYVYRRAENLGRAGSFTIGDTTYYVGSNGSHGDNPTDETGYVLSTDTTYDGALSSAGGTVLSDVDQGNYVKFSGLTGSSFTLDMGALSDDSAPRSKVAGIQIVAIPEPATIGLVGLTGIGLFLARRFRR
jgi:hypothetical protein